MRNSMKVAKWEFKRNIKNKSFLISLIITPIIFILFATLPSLLEGLGNDDEAVTVYLYDELNIMPQIEKIIKQDESINWSIKKTTSNEATMLEQLKTEENTAYIPLSKSILLSGNIQVYTSKGINDDFSRDLRIFTQPLQLSRLNQLELTSEQLQVVTSEIVFSPVLVEDTAKEGNSATATSQDPLIRIIPGLFAGIILFSISMTGMMIFQSASQEKKEKVAEIVLSSVTPVELMQGKIIGYFWLGMTQVIVWLGIIVPIVVLNFDEIPIIEYLLVPELLLLLFIAIVGYLLFAAIFVGLGATVEDVNSSSNFQGLVLMLPFMPFIFIGPILDNPSGLAAKIGTYIPFSSPTVLLMRLSMLEVWPWKEIIIALVLLLISVWLLMKIAGKIFKVGILMYGKNASPKEIWKWLRA
ncbi:ABC transporter permease [Cytobacillus sp. IB215316]|uniref:ABC transporter permease n=1 Tax=Cytobacillus sp. IB215316 TaxID=3097354 RepID=UPI002A0FD84B|nr:ABC transporter permease [Cytobacillus sp. IB215316]MDX8362630.1 ABC transporter permease [Cytobacillus sp. IB215316]